MNFIAEIKEVRAKKLQSLDMEIGIRLVTDDINVLDLGKIPSDRAVQVTIKEMSSK